MIPGDKKKRKPRRNWEKEHRELETWCRISIDVYRELESAADATMSDTVRLYAARRDSLETILKKLEGK